MITFYEYISVKQIAEGPLIKMHTENGAFQCQGAIVTKLYSLVAQVLSLKNPFAQLYMNCDSSNHKDYPNTEAEGRFFLKKKKMNSH